MFACVKEGGAVLRRMEEISDDDVVGVGCFANEFPRVRGVDGDVGGAEG
jgi:hypothetical protein